MNTHNRVFFALNLVAIVVALLWHHTLSTQLRVRVPSMQLNMVCEYALLSIDHVVVSNCGKDKERFVFQEDLVIIESNHTKGK